MAKASFTSHLISSRVVEQYSIYFLLATLLLSPRDSYCSATSKCLINSVANSSAGEGETAFPEIHLVKLLPPTVARNLIEIEKPPGLSSLVQWKNGSLIVPSTLDTLRFECSAKYRVQWGFESYPWITWDTWTGIKRPTNRNESVEYTAVLEFHRVQETSLQTRIPICYNTQNPCIQTALVPHSGPRNTVEIKVANGSNFAIKSKSDKEQFGFSKNCSLRFGYDPTSQKFYCQETDKTKPSSGKIFLRPCPDPVTCESLIAPSNCSAESDPMIPIIECTMENRCRMETALAGKFAGIAVCHSGSPTENSLATPYFFALNYNISSNKTNRYLEWKNADPNEMVHLQSIDKQVYTNEKISLVCNASYFYIGSGMHFTLTKEGISLKPLDTDAWESDKSKEVVDEEEEKETVKEIIDELTLEKNELERAEESVIYDEANIGGIGSKLPLIRMLHVNDFLFDAPGKYEISCYAPVWNTTEWAKASTIISVKESIVPTFDGGNLTVKQYYAPNKRLECIAYGTPKPELNWTRDGSSIPNEIILTTGEQNQSLVWAYLTFPKAEYGIQGNFTCTASNVAGTVMKSFIIIPADKNSSTAIWVLVGLAVLITILVPMILFLVWKVRRQKQYIDYLSQEEVEEFINGKPDYIPFHCDMSTYAYYLPYNKSYEIPRDSLEIDPTRILGSGEYGLVVYGLYKNANPPGGGPPIVKPVAVKTTKPLKSGKEFFKALLSELKIMTYIGSHENIVNLIGACTENIRRKEVYIATEYCEHGSLLAYLRSNRHAYENPLSYAELAHARSISSMSEETSFINYPPVIGADSLHSKSIGESIAPDVQYVKMEDLGNVVVNQNYENLRNVKLLDLMQWAYDIACGMEFLASKKVIHGDLAARNVLISRSFTAKIGDFGLSRQLHHYTSYTKTAVTPLPLKWLAIECLQNFQFSIESDVWAYGVTLYEIFTIGEIPYSSVNMNGEQFLQALMHGMRLCKPSYAPNDVFDLMMKCWKHDRKQRPTFSEIVKFFQPKAYRRPLKKISESILSSDIPARSTTSNSFASMTNEDLSSRNSNFTNEKVDL